MNPKETKQASITVPIKILGLYLGQKKQVSSPSSDFSRLPWFDTQSNTDVNFNSPFISKDCLRQPFQTPNTMLGKGVHLHFILPQYLGRKIPDSLALPNKGQIPAAVNRWLITKNTTGSKTQQWYLESDYIHAENYDPKTFSCSLPYPTGKPYRYIGRLQPINNTPVTLPPPAEANQYFKGQNKGKPLTIMGHGELNFSSFYPNCNTVFGFYDPEGSLDSSTTYSVIGWHDSPDDDLLFQAMTQWFTSKNESSSHTEIELAEELKRVFDLDLATTKNSSDSIVTTMPTVFHGEFKADQQAVAPDPSNTKVAIGQTGTEALSSYLAYSLSQEVNKNKEEAKSIIEDQLESVLMFSQLDENNIDVGAKFNEARHSKGFRPSHGGDKWTIQTIAAKNLPTTPSAEALPPLPSGLGTYLNKLNEVQQVFHQATQEIATLQKQLYADWNKYMQARYPTNVEPDQFPDADHIQYFITNYCIAPIQQKTLETGLLSIDPTTLKPTAHSNNPIDLAHQVQAKWEILDDFIQSENNQRVASQEPLLAISKVAGARYWEAKAPTVLLSGLPEEVATFNNSISVLEDEITGNNVSISLSSLVTALAGKNKQQLSSQAWNPFLLDWEFNLNPVQLKQGGGMANSSLLSNFNLDDTGPDFNTKNTAYSNNTSIFSGTAILSGHTRNTKERVIEGYFKNTITKEGLTFVAKKTLADVLSTNIWTDACACFESNNFFIPSAETAAIPNAYYSLWKAYQKLDGQQFLSQTLDGFYEACIQLNKVPQFPIKEPIGFSSEKAFTELVKATVGNQRGVSPETAFEFNPIACGIINPERLSLIDNFGRSTTINVEGDIPFSDTMNVSMGNSMPYLKPRLTQAARLSFNWLSASTSWNSVESPTNEDITSSPVCGWLMNNYLDNNIAIYDANGKALGYIDRQAKWNTVPWNTGASTIEANIQNTHLYHVAQQIMASPTFMEDFMNTVENAQSNIAPQDALLHSTKSMLVGKPIAVVRASVGLETKGLPTIDQSWASLIHDLDNCNKQNQWSYAQRYKQNWTTVQFPCRLGEHMQMNDGLIGYWTENSAGVLSDNFVAPQTTTNTINNAKIDQYKLGIFQDQPLVLNASPLKMTMLMDPHGLIHATTGILPTKVLSIPDKHYLPALQKMKVWFASSPIIQGIGLDKKIQLGLPKVPAMQWQWWDPYNGASTIENNETNSNTSSEIKEGWILLENSSKNQNI